MDMDPSLPIIELGIGWGNDTSLLLSKGYTVKGCDFSEESLKIMKALYPQAEVVLHDLNKGLPPEYADNSTNVVIADLCLHYFRMQELMSIIKDIQRVLRPSGILLCRVNSINDVNYGIGEGLEIEPNVYDTSSGIKMFFDEQMLREIFADWDIINLKEYSVGRFDRPKTLWEAAVQKR